MFTDSIVHKSQRSFKKSPQSSFMFRRKRTEKEKLFNNKATQNMKKIVSEYNSVVVHKDIVGKEA
jgi:hypothetical protein